MAGGEVEVVDLVKKFNEVTAVDGINLQMPAGEFFSMLGPSGCGKTTTLRMIAGIEQPTSGQILLDGHNMAFTPPHKRNVNMVFQNYALFPHLNVFDNIAFGLRRDKRPKAEIRRRVADALELVQLTGFEARAPHPPRRAEFGRQVHRLDRAARGAERHGALNFVLQLTDVARPPVLREELQRV